MNDSILSITNDYLRTLTSVAKQDGDTLCEENSQVHLVSDYGVLYQSDTLIFFEFLVFSPVSDSFINYYNPVLLNPEKGNLFLSPEAIWPDFKRSKIRKAVVEYGQINELNINELAYRDSSNHLISFGVNRDSLFLYPGAEGEFFGYGRLGIPLAELGLSPLE